MTSSSEQDPILKGKYTFDSISPERLSNLNLIDVYITSLENKNNFLINLSGKSPDKKHTLYFTIFCSSIIMNNISPGSKTNITSPFYHPQFMLRNYPQSSLSHTSPISDDIDLLRLILSTSGSFSNYPVPFDEMFNLNYLMQSNYGSNGVIATGPAPIIHDIANRLKSKIDVSVTQTSTFPEPLSIISFDDEFMIAKSLNIYQSKRIIIKYWQVIIAVSLCFSPSFFYDNTEVINAIIVIGYIFAVGSFLLIAMAWNKQQHFSR